MVNNIEIKDNFNAGGHLNNEFFWDSLSPVSQGGGEMPEGVKLNDAIVKSFGSSQ